MSGYVSLDLVISGLVKRGQLNSCSSTLRQVKNFMLLCYIRQCRDRFVEVRTD
jgi:hypothetical protein